MAIFHVGRLLGYAAMGALVATAMQQMAWYSDRSSWLHPLWLLMHLAILAWGVLMLFQGRQPIWLESAGRWVWLRAQPILRLPGGILLAGVLWALLPCGLLYSALLVAALTGQTVSGAASMLVFGVGSGLWLWMAPWIWRISSVVLGRLREQWAPRIAGGLLVVVALFALWRDIVYAPAVWCR